MQLPAASPPPCPFWAPARGIPWVWCTLGTSRDRPGSLLGSLGYLSSTDSQIPNTNARMSGKSKQQQQIIKKCIPNSGRILPNILPKNIPESVRDLTKTFLNPLPEVLGDIFWATLPQEAPRTEKKTENKVRWPPPRAPEGASKLSFSC